MSPNDLAAINIVKIGAPIILTGVAMATYLTSTCRRAKDSDSEKSPKLPEWRVSVAPTPWRAPDDKQDSFRVFFTPIHPKNGRVKKELLFTVSPDHFNLEDFKSLGVGDVIRVEVDGLESTTQELAISSARKDPKRIRIASIKPFIRH